MYKYKVRFHLGAGEHFMHWQIKAWDGSVKYVDPAKYDIEMLGCTLVNKINKARKVHNAGVKDVCGWVECENFFIHRAGTFPIYHELERLHFNPIRDVHWRRDDDAGDFAWDGCWFDSLITQDKGVYVIEECAV